MPSENSPGAVSAGPSSRGSTGRTCTRKTPCGEFACFARARFSPAIEKQSATDRANATRGTLSTLSVLKTELSSSATHCERGDETAGEILQACILKSLRFQKSALHCAHRKRPRNSLRRADSCNGSETGMVNDRSRIQHAETCRAELASQLFHSVGASQIKRHEAHTVCDPQQRVEDVLAIIESDDEPATGSEHTRELAE